jgi:hypothetical protein
VLCDALRCISPCVYAFHTLCAGSTVSTQPLAVVCPLLCHLCLRGLAVVQRCVPSIMLCDDSRTACGTQDFPRLGVPKHNACMAGQHMHALFVSKAAADVHHLSTCMCEAGTTRGVPRLCCASPGCGASLWLAYPLTSLFPPTQVYRNRGGQGLPVHCSAGVAYTCAIALSVFAQAPRHVCGLRNERESCAQCCAGVAYTKM